MYIEGSPFTSDWEKLMVPGNKLTFDSVVGKIGNLVVKWPRRRIYDPEEAFAICEYLKRSYQLYSMALGKEFMVPTTIVLGKKINGRGAEYKPYIVQPYIDSLTARDLPDETKRRKDLMDQWERLFGRLCYLYRESKKINRSFLNDRNRFPIGITVGLVRQMAIEGVDQVFSLASTSNILVANSQPPQILLADLGPYHVWHEEMEEAFNQICGLFK